MSLCAPSRMLRAQWSAICRAVFVYFLSACYGAALCAQEASSSNDAPVIPSSTELEAQRFIIGEISIDNGNVFDTSTPAENKALFRLANRLHIKSRADVIAQHLLFKSGDVYSDRIIRESERILRANQYLYDASIEPVRVRDGVVDLIVHTRDVWTFKPGINFGRQGGENTSGFEIQESNLLGYGKEVTIARRKSVDRDSAEYRYLDRRLFGTWSRLQLSYSSNSDGQRRYAGWQRPFYSLDSTWAANANALDWDRVDQRYNLGQVVDEFRHYQERLELSGGVSTGWENGWVKRFNFGAQYMRDRFAPTGSAFTATQLPQDRRLLYPYVGFLLLQDDFEERRNQNQIERTEDLYAGTFVFATAGLAEPAFDADRRAWLFSLGGGASFESLDKKHTLVLSTSSNGRVESGSWRNLMGSAAATYYWRNAERQLFYASVHGAAAKNLDTDRQLTLGGDSGLRGYPLRYQDGTANALLTLEHRIFTQYYLFRLFHIGGAVFYDMGRSWGTGVARRANPSSPLNAISDQGVLKDVGIGLRFGSSRSAFGNVIHVDLAFPLDGDRSIDNVQFIIETKQSF